METIYEYGKVGLAIHFGFSLAFYGAACLLIHRTKHLTRILTFLKIQDKIPRKAGTAATGYIVYKAAMPLRLAVSAMAIPLIVSFWGVSPSKSPADKVTIE